MVQAVYPKVKEFAQFEINEQTTIAQAQVEGHDELFGLQQALLSSTPTDVDREHIAIMARTVIQMHLTMLAD